MIEESKKAISTVDLALSAVGLLKSAALVFGVVLIEWARARQRLAENRQAVAESNERITVAKAAVDEQNSDKSHTAVIAEYLAESRSGQK